MESNRPKSPEAFDFTQTEAAIVWSGSGVCLGISPSNLPGLRSLASAQTRGATGNGPEARGTARAGLSAMAAGNSGVAHAALRRDRGSHSLTLAGRAGNSAYQDVTRCCLPIIVSGLLRLSSQAAYAEVRAASGTRGRVSGRRRAQRHKSVVQYQRAVGDEHVLKG